MHPGIGEGCLGEPRFQPAELRLREVALNDDEAVDITARGIERVLGERAVQVDAGELVAEDLNERGSDSSHGGSDERGDASPSQKCTLRSV